MSTTTKQRAMSVAEFLYCDLQSGADLARIRAALEQRERLLAACKAAWEFILDDTMPRSAVYEQLLHAIAAAEGR